MPEKLRPTDSNTGSTSSRKRVRQIWKQMRQHSCDKLPPGQGEMVTTDLSNPEKYKREHPREWGEYMVVYCRQHREQQPCQNSASWFHFFSRWDPTKPYYQIDSILSHHTSIAMKSYGSYPCAPQNKDRTATKKSLNARETSFLLWTAVVAITAFNWTWQQFSWTFRFWYGSVDDG